MGLKSYKEYKGVGLPWLDKIPNHWKDKKIKYLFSERNIRDSSDSPLLLASQKHGVILKSMYETRTVEAQKNLENLKLVKEGDFVISLRSFQGGIEYAYYSGIISPAYTIMIPEGEIDSDYFKYLAKSINFIELLKMNVTGIREGQNIDYNKLKDAKIPVPTIEEQRKIGLFLDNKLEKIDSFIDLKTKQIELLKEQKQAMINKAVTKGLDENVFTKDSGIEWIGDIPQRWKVVKIKHLFKVVNGATPDSGNINYWNGNINWITPKDLSKENYYVSGSERTITENGYNSCSTKMIEKGNIVMATRAPIGSIRINKINLCLNQGCKGLITIRETMNTMYSYFLLNAFLPVIKKLGKGTTFPELSTLELSNFKLVIPDKEEQKRISRHIEKEANKTHETIDLYKNEIELIKEYKISLISSAVTGKIDVRDTKGE